MVENERVRMHLYTIICIYGETYSAHAPELLGQYFWTLVRMNLWLPTRVHVFGPISILLKPP